MSTVVSLLGLGIVEMHFDERILALDLEILFDLSWGLQKFEREKFSVCVGSR